MKFPMGAILVPEKIPEPELTKKGNKKSPKRYAIYCGKCHEQISSLSCQCWD